MNPATLNTSAQFFNAAATYYGVPADQLVLGGQVGSVNGVFAITLQIALTPDDLIGITKRMAQLDKERAGKALDDFLGEPRAGMPLAKSAEFDAEGLTGSWREPNSEGVAGRTVVHADVPEEDGDAGLPAAVWAPISEMSDQQAMLVSDARGGKGLLQVALLTDEQKAKYVQNTADTKGGSQ